MNHDQDPLSAMREAQQHQISNSRSIGAEKNLNLVRGVGAVTLTRGHDACLGAQC
jgi:hypothetical protein